MAPPRGATHTAGPNHMEAYMKLHLPAAAAATGAAQAQIDTHARRCGVAVVADLATLVDPTPTPVTQSGSAPLQRPRPTPAALGSQLSAGGLQ